MSERLTDNGNDKIVPLAQRLASELSNSETQHHPDPNSFRQAGKLLSLYFRDKMQEGAQAPERIGNDFPLALTNTLSVLKYLYYRDQQTHRTVRGKIGEHQSDNSITSALKDAESAQKQVANRANRYVLDSLHETRTMISKFEIKDASDSLREKAVDTLKIVALSGIMHYPEAFHDMAKVGVHVCEAIVDLSEVVGHHDHDIGFTQAENQKHASLHLSTALLATIQ